MSDNNERYRKTVELQKLMRDPAAVQALIAENERLRVDLKSVVRLNNENADLFKAKNDQLKAENNRLKSAANTLARIGYRDHSGELWKPPIGQKPNFDLIDQLRAEVAGLKTGYEAYERVNAELKAECARSTEREILQLAEIEALRREREGKVLCDRELFETLRDSANTEADEHRQCMATYRPLRQASLDSVVKKCDDLLAAMGKGEQS